MIKSNRRKQKSEERRAISISYHSKDKLLIKLEQGIESAGKTILCSERNVWFKMKWKLYDRMSRSASKLTGQNVRGLHTSYLRFWLARNARAYTSFRSIGFCVIWVCISSSSSFCLCAICPSFAASFVKDGRGLCPEGSATLCRLGYRSKEPTTKSGYADELHLKESRRFYGDVTAVYAGFCDAIYVWLVKITSPRNLRRKS